MNVYVVMDCSLNMVLDMSNREGRYRKFDRGVRFLGQVVEALDKNECEITLVCGICPFPVNQTITVFATVIQ